MNTLLFFNSISQDPGTTALLIALAIVGVLLFAAMMFAIITKIVVAITYTKYNRINCEKGDNALELTEQNLEHCNLENVSVVKASWLRSLLGLNVQSYGNSYSTFRKKIFLRKNIVSKSTVTSYAVSTQKVAHAVFDSEKKYGFYYKIKPLMIFAPVLIIPFIVLGLILDFSVGSGFGIFTIVLSLVSIGLFLLSFIMLLITIPIEKKANIKAQEILLETNSVTDDEMVGVKKVHKAYILSYVADFIYAILQLVWDILKAILKAANYNNRTKK